MIEIEIIRKGDRIISLTSKGHAGYADYGQDIVCAGTSAIIFGLFNAIDMVDNTIEKVQSPIDTVVKISTTVDKAHDATIKACKDAKEFVDNNAVIIKEKVSGLMSKKEEEVKEPSPEDIIGGD